MALKVECCNCHKLLRGDANGEQISHGICKECCAKLYPECPVCGQIVDTRHPSNVHDDIHNKWYHHDCIHKAAENHS